MANLLVACRSGKHQLQNIYSSSDPLEPVVIRWCSVCGSIVGDIESDGRIYPGLYQKMISPEVSKRLILDELEKILCSLAGAWRQNKDYLFVEKYREVMERMFELGWNGVLDVECELPDELMPPI